MSPARPAFDNGISYARSIRGVYLIARSAAASLDLSDLLRAQIVSAVSAFDLYIHELVRFGMLEIQIGARPTTPAYDRFPVSLQAVSTSLTNPSWLDLVIRERHGYLSFQFPDKVADAVRHFSEKTLWREVGSRIGLAEERVKERLKLIVQRRNKIVHEADVDPLTGARWTVSEADIDSSIDFLEQVAHAIDALVW